MCHWETQRAECHCGVGRVKKTAWGFQLRVAVAAVSLRAAVSAETLCHPSWRGQGDKELSHGAHTARGTSQWCWLNGVFLFSPIKRPCVRCSPWASVLDVFFHMSFAVELSTELIPATCAALSGSCGCSSQTQAVELYAFVSRTEILKKLETCWNSSIAGE